MPSSRITSKGQLTLPREIRDKLRVGPGDRVSFVERPDGSIAVEPETVDLFTLRGLFKPKVRGVTLADMDRAVRRGAARGRGRT